MLIGKNRTQASRLLSPSQRNDLLILPRMHLEMILAGSTRLDYQHCIAGMLNIAIALANLKRRSALELELNRAQDIMAQLITGQRSPTAPERVTLLAAIDSSERLISFQTRQDIAKAVAYIDRKIEQGIAHTPSQRMSAISGDQKKAA